MSDAELPVVMEMAPCCWGMFDVWDREKCPAAFYQRNLPEFNESKLFGV